MVGRPPLFDNPEQLQQAVDRYLEETKKTELTITGLALYLGFESRQSFYDYEEKSEFSYIIKRARLHIENGYELKLNSNACTGAIFALKNMGWKDKTEVENSGSMGIIWQETLTYGSDKEADDRPRLPA
jgi:hypothetical protein